MADVKMWAIKTCTGEFWPGSIRKTRDDAWDATPLKQSERRIAQQQESWVAVRVSVREIKKGKNRGK